MIRSTRRPLRLALLLAVALLLASMALAGIAAADPVKITDHYTRLTVDPAVTAALAGAGIAILPVDPASAEPVNREGCTVRYKFPITQGMVDPGSLAGTIWHSGGLNFVRISDGAMLKATDFKIDTVEQKLYGLVGDAYVPLLDLDLSAIEVGGKFPHVIVENVVASLTPEAAEALNSTFGADIVTAGMRIGTAKVALRLPCWGHTEVVFDPAILQALSGAGLLCLPVAPATVTPVIAGAPYGFEGFTLAYHFPITSRDLKGSDQSIWHSGGLRCINVAACKWVTLTRFKIDPVDEYLSGCVNCVSRAKIFDLDLSAVTTSTQGVYTVLAPVELALTDGAAALLNQKLKVELFQGGMVVGQAKVVVRI